MKTQLLIISIMHLGVVSSLAMEQEHTSKMMYCGVKVKKPQQISSDSDSGSDRERDEVGYGYGGFSSVYSMNEIFNDIVRNKEQEKQISLLDEKYQEIVTGYLTQYATMDALDKKDHKEYIMALLLARTAAQDQTIKIHKKLDGAKAYIHKNYRETAPAVFGKLLLSILDENIPHDNEEIKKRYAHSKNMITLLNKSNAQLAQITDLQACLKGEVKDLNAKITSLQNEVVQKKMDIAENKINKQHSIINSLIIEALQAEDIKIVENKKNKTEEAIMEIEAKIIEIQQQELEHKKPQRSIKVSYSSPTDLKAQRERETEKLRKLKLQLTEINEHLSRINQEGTVVGNLKRSWWG